MVLRPCTRRKAITGFINFVNTLGALHSLKDKQVNSYKVFFQAKRRYRRCFQQMLTERYASFRSMEHIQSEPCSKSLSIPVPSILKCDVSKLKHSEVSNLSPGKTSHLFLGPAHKLIRTGVDLGHCMLLKKSAHLLLYQLLFYG